MAQIAESLPYFCCGVDTDVFGVSPAGGDIERFTQGPGDDHDPAWSPDGKKLAFARLIPALGVGSSDIYVFDTTTLETTALTSTPEFTERFPSWSPDGTRIAFTGGPTYYPYIHDIFVMDADGGNRTQLTDAPGNQTEPAWSPRGDVIAYVDERNLGNGDTSIRRNKLRLITPDGSARGVVITTPRDEFISSPSWSPDGRRIAVSRGLEGSVAIWVIHRYGSNGDALTTSGQFNGMPAWSPDGSWIAFLSNRDEGGNRLYKMRPDGTDVTRIIDITLTGETAAGIDWGPRP